MPKDIEIVARFGARIVDPKHCDYNCPHLLDIDSCRLFGALEYPEDAEKHVAARHADCVKAEINARCIDALLGDK
jgi:hypothetical protein